MKDRITQAITEAARLGRERAKIADALTAARANVARLTEAGDCDPEAGAVAVGKVSFLDGRAQNIATAIEAHAVAMADLAREAKARVEELRATAEKTAVAKDVRALAGLLVEDKAGQIEAIAKAHGRHTRAAIAESRAAYARTFGDDPEAVLRGCMETL